MKVIVLVLVSFAVVATSLADLQCDQKDIDIEKEWIDMGDTCVSIMKAQIQKELYATMQYLAMGAHFARSKINRLGFAKFFFHSASEERQHALNLISYLLMRGEEPTVINIDEIKTIINNATVLQSLSGVDALKDALRVETEVTKHIRDVIKTCEKTARIKAGQPNNKYNDYHLVDYLTGVFLEEQYKGQRDLAGKISKLEKMKKDHGILGEFMFDKKLLEE